MTSSSRIDNITYTLFYLDSFNGKIYLTNTTTESMVFAQDYKNVELHDEIPFIRFIHSFIGNISVRNFFLFFSNCVESEFILNDFVIKLIK